MKALIFSYFFMIFVGGEWSTDFAASQQQAKQENKLILLNFSGSDWCAPCIKLKKDVFEQEAFKSYANDNLVLVRSDFPRLKRNQLPAAQVGLNEKLAEKYNPQGKFPYTLLLKPDGTVIHEWDGYPGVSPDEFVNQVKNLQSK